MDLTQEIDDEIPFYEKKKEGDPFINKMKRVVTSSLLFIISFIFSNLLLQFLIARLAKVFKYTVSFSYNQVRVRPWDYHYWSRPRIIFIYLISPIICLLLGVLIFNVLRLYSSWANIFRLFLFWLAIVLVNMVLCQVLIAPLGNPDNRNNGLYQTFAIVGAWLWLNPAIMVMGAIGSLITSLLTGMLIRKELMRYSFSKTLIETKKGMDTVVMQIFILPVIFGAVPVLMLCTSVSFFPMLMQVVNLAIISIGIFMMNSINIAVVRCNKEDVLNHVPFVELSVCLAAWFSIYWFLRF